MQVRTKQGLQVLRRVHTFLDTRPFTVAIGDLAVHTQTLAALVQRLERHSMEQETRARLAREMTTRKNVYGRALRQEYLRPISRLARWLFSEDPALRESFVLPTGRDDEGLLQAARAVAERARAHAPLFVANGLAADFVERLETATEAFRNELLARGIELARRSAATAGMLQEMNRGREQVRLLDAMLAPRLEGQDGLEAEWRSITRFVRPRVVEATGVVAPGGGGATPIMAPPVVTPPVTGPQVGVGTTEAKAA